MSTEIRRKVTFQPTIDDNEAKQPLEEFTLVDGAGRVQIPQDLLDQMKIKNRANINLQDGKLTISTDDV